MSEHESCPPLGTPKSYAEIQATLRKNNPVDPTMTQSIADQVVEAKLNSALVNLNQSIEKLSDSVRNVWEAASAAQGSNKISSSDLERLHQRLSHALDDLMEVEGPSDLTDMIEVLNK
jgi:predicted  nucleic acid-binding Zn-ribbon protein